MILLISDLHFSSRPQDAYFFDLFPLVSKLIKTHKVTSLMVLGDITEKKAGHSAELLNTIADGFSKWAKEVDSITIVSGNHDGVVGSYPFWEFLGHIEGIRYIKTPLVEGHRVFLPHSRYPEQDWQGIDFKGKQVFAHVTVKGAVYESGVKCDSGIEASFFKGSKLVLSGDVHSRSTVDGLHYVGSPYQIKMGDKYQGGGILLDEVTNKWKYLDFDFPKRSTISASSFDLNNFNKGDQVKLKVEVTKENLDSYRKEIDQLKVEAEKKGITVYIDLKKEFNKIIATKKDTPFQSFDQYCSSQRINADLIAFGKQILKEAL